MTTETKAFLLEEIGGLHDRYARGDVTEKNFGRSLDKLILKYFRALVVERLDEGETPLEEHHAVLGHLKLSQSILKETGQELISYYATDRRLARLRTLPERAYASPAELAGTEYSDVQYGDISGVKTAREVRKGEMITGGVILLVALVFYNTLKITGPLMALLGILGMLHGFLLPTRWAVVETSGGGEMPIYAPRKKSARKLLRAVRKAVASSK